MLLLLVFKLDQFFKLQANYHEQAGKIYHRDSFLYIIYRFINRSNLSEGFQCLLLVGMNACAKGKADADTAVAAARESYPVSTLNNGIGDAFRHCYWNALMTISVGRDAAKKIADLHEDHNTAGSAAAREMDLKNNEIGREVGSQSKTSEEARTKCHEHAQTGYLQVKL